ncbi:MAG TPA: prepilin-type N-terminal cleavage/methylation domain-containing protein [Gemmatimonadales bacterium]|nr:prepilin-type N-terminal cleavage/methylation domain-containing protein [Gemmatimonadales bacterium]
MRNNKTRELSNSGFSLVEMLIVIVVAGLLMAMALPKLRNTLAQRDVNSARAAVANMYARARINALQTRKSTTINFSSTDTWVTVPITGGLDTIGAVAQLATLYGVSVNASVASITVLPTGLSNMGSTATITVTRSGKSDSVMISGYGRLK